MASGVRMVVGFGRSVVCSGVSVIEAVITAAMTVVGVVLEVGIDLTPDKLSHKNVIPIKNIAPPIAQPAPPLGILSRR